MELELKTQQATTKADLERNRIAAKRLEIEAKIAALAARRAELDAQATLRKTQKDPNATTEDRQLAQQGLDLARQNREAADQTVGDATSNIASQEQQAMLARERLAVDQQTRRAQFDAAETTRMQTQQVEITQSRIRSLPNRLSQVLDASPTRATDERLNPASPSFDHDAFHAEQVRRAQAAIQQPPQFSGIVPISMLQAAPPVNLSSMTPSVSPPPTNGMNTEVLNTIRQIFPPINQMTRLLEGINTATSATANRPSNPVMIAQDALERSKPNMASEIRRKAGL